MNFRLFFFLYFNFILRLQILTALESMLMNYMKTYVKKNPVVQIDYQISTVCL